MLIRRICKQCSTLFFLLCFAPLTATAAQQDELASSVSTRGTGNTPEHTNIPLPDLIHNSSEAFTDIASANLDGLLERIGDSRLVLLGEATHGSAEFYDMRARITRELIENKGFNIIAVEADWPDAETINHFVLGTSHTPARINKPFTTFPRWMWANYSVLAFAQWLQDYNQHLSSNAEAVSFYGLDFYNMFASVERVIDYLQYVDPGSADIARRRYACLMPWTSDPANYSRAITSGRYQHCGYEVHAVLQNLRNNSAQYRQPDAQRFFSAVQNARLIKNAERFYRNMYNTNFNTWNLRDQSMFDTLQEILNTSGDNSKVVIWAHNTHIGDARAMEMSTRGEINLGQRVREHFANDAYLVGFGTDHGTVGAATEWGKPMQVMQIPAAHSDSYEHQFHQVKANNFLLPLRNPLQALARDKLLAPKLQRAIGTTYYPDTELDTHYSYVSLPRQFDEYIWFDETHAVVPLSRDPANGAADTSPFGL